MPVHLVLGAHWIVEFELHFSHYTAFEINIFPSILSLFTVIQPVGVKQINYILRMFFLSLVTSRRYSRCVFIEHRISLTKQIYLPEVANNCRCLFWETSLTRLHTAANIINEAINYLLRFFTKAWQVVTQAEQAGPGGGRETTEECARVHVYYDCCYCLDMTEYRCFYNPIWNLNTKSSTKTLLNALRKDRKFSQCVYKLNEHIYFI